MIRFVGRVRVATACNVISTHTHTYKHTRYDHWRVLIASNSSGRSPQVPLGTMFHPITRALCIYTHSSVWPVDNDDDDEDDDVFQSFENYDRGGGRLLLQSNTCKRRPAISQHYILNCTPRGYRKRADSVITRP